jgi:hypothetical protein
LLSLVAVVAAVVVNKRVRVEVVLVAYYQVRVILSVLIL